MLDMRLMKSLPYLKECLGLVSATSDRQTRIALGKLTEACDEAMKNEQGLFLVSD